MAKQITLENTLAGGFGLPTGQVVPGTGSIVLEPEVWDAAKDHPVVKARIDAGTLIVDGKGKKSAETSADVTVLQARVTELESLLKTANDEITALKAGNGSGSAETDVEKMTVEELKAFLTSKSVAFTDEKKPELLELAREAAK
ncbi:MAG TPA: hypothetical protein VIL30_14600 [Ramlibacter sp.]|jgi:hypothetical protein